jgi:predicted adenylyl cyclase CyaB
MQNIEVKSPLQDRLKVEKKLSALGARPMWVRNQRDTFYRVPEGWLKLREAEGKPAELISYKRATGERGPRVSDYDVIVVGEGAAAKSLLGRVLPVDKVVEKERTLWIYEHTRVHLDRVKGLGEYLELETVVEGMDPGAALEETGRIVEVLGLNPAEFIAVPYRDLV